MTKDILYPEDVSDKAIKRAIDRGSLRIKPEGRITPVFFYAYEICCSDYELYLEEKRGRITNGITA